VLHDPWAARDAYIDVLLGELTIDDFLAQHSPPGADHVLVLTLLEEQRHALLMYTSCGWFFNDLAGTETVQILRYAARAIDLLDEMGEPVDVDRFISHSSPCSKIAIRPARSPRSWWKTARDAWRTEVARAAWPGR
jgi:alpha-amylase/alpha-mannosidase (GH57 family)